MRIKVLISPGEDITESAERSVRLAKLFGLVIQFDFNGLWCYVNCHDTPEEVVAHYHRESARENSPYRVARR